MHGNHHHHHHQRTDLGVIMSITSVFTIGPFVPCTPLCKILNTPVMSICLVKQNDGTWVEKHQRFLINVCKRFFYFCHVFKTFFNVFYFFLERFLHLCFRAHINIGSSYSQHIMSYNGGIDAVRAGGHSYFLLSITRINTGYDCKIPRRNYSSISD